MYRLLQIAAFVAICLSMGVELYSIETLKEIWKIRQAILTCTNQQNYGCRCDPVLNGLCNFYCIPLEKRCNGFDDCPLGDDETDCPPDLCGKDQVCCQDGSCATVCDGTIECTNMADEQHCEPQLSSRCPGEMECPGGDCATVCNGVIECDEGKDCDEDEKDCRHVCITDRSVVCNTEGTCGVWCNGHSECPNGSDETDCYIECDEDEVSCSLETPNNVNGCAEMCDVTSECEGSEPIDEDDVFCGDCVECGIANVECAKTTPGGC